MFAMLNSFVSLHIQLIVRELPWELHLDLQESGPQIKGQDCTGLREQTSMWKATEDTVSSNKDCTGSDRTLPGWGPVSKDVNSQSSSQDFLCHP